mmetsp:Transcript_20626/g.30862  ORF Transcript_20626/g.30862 Transcript_20626/m.30862 type:complete len:1014 (-) Transcript_20626:229-3270(-)|eukprot:CAMPEP_0167749860 /NCGR_PEP_ID=MMETSP0110_2-20121227/5656_1 /TAXON_ID=629695 /ORGANISM="Gymnochlora sp., Strain CCMP2014" /LENGTH=1013 /DNA_ID=CAMNT_0007635089 /DNA_START=52 /DNA_END=3093 /DNA_ORIENTATION=+
MGSTVTVLNDTEKTIFLKLTKRDGKKFAAVKGWNAEIKPGEKTLKTGDGLDFVDQYELEIKSEYRNATHKFYMYRKLTPINFKASLLMDGKFLAVLELQSLVTYILPGLRIEDREYYGEVYEEVFVANELITYMIVHKVALSSDDAEVMCQKLLQFKVFEEVIEGLKFENKFMFFRLNTDSKLVQAKGKMLLKKNHMNLPMARFYRFTGSANQLQSPRVSDLRTMEGWMEKKSRMGMWSMRFFRIIPGETEKLSDVIAYYEDCVSIKHKGTIPLNTLETVQMYGKSGKVFSISVKNSKKIYYIRCSRAEQTTRWVNALQEFSQIFSPEDTLLRSRLALIFSRKMVHQLVKLMTTVHVKKGEWICKKGDIIDTLFVLKEGDIGLYINIQETMKKDGKTIKKEGKEQYYYSQTPVSTFGEQVLFPNLGIYQWGASRRANEDCVLLKLTSAAASKYIKSQIRNRRDKNSVQIVREVWRDILRARVDLIVKKLPLFRDLNIQQKNILKLGLQCRPLTKGQTLFYEGDPARELYIVFKGKLAQIQYSHQKKEEVILKKFRSGNAFGEVALMLSGVPQTTRVTAMEPTVMLTLPAETFKKFMELNKLDLSIMARAKLVNLFQEAKIPMFEGIPKSKFMDLARVCKIETYKSGDIIFKQGDVGQRFYMISHGSAVITVDGKDLAVVEKGGYFGEISIVLPDTARTATVTAQKRCVILSLDKEGFQTFFAGRPHALAEVELKIAGRRCQMRSVLYHKKGIELFQLYLEKHLAEETVIFWRAARAFRKLAKRRPNRTQEIRERAIELLHNFIGSEAKTQLNISSRMSDTILEDFKKENITPALFAVAEEEAVNMMARDKLRGFCNSGFFDQLMQAVGGGYNLNLQRKVDKKGGRERSGSYVGVKANLSYSNTSTGQPSRSTVGSSAMSTNNILSHTSEKTGEEKEQKSRFNIAIDDYQISHAKLKGILRSPTPLGSERGVGSSRGSSFHEEGKSHRTPTSPTSRAHVDDVNQVRSEVKSIHE